MFSPGKIIPAIIAAAVLTSCSKAPQVIQKEIGDSSQQSSEYELASSKLDVINGYLALEGQYTIAVLIDDKGYLGLINKDGLAFGATLTNDNEDIIQASLDSSGVRFSVNETEGEPKLIYEFGAFSKNEDFDAIFLAAAEEALVGNGCVTEGEGEQIITLDNVSLSYAITDTANMLNSMYSQIYEVTKDDKDFADSINEKLGGKWDTTEGISSDMFKAYLQMLLDKADGYLLNTDNVFTAELVFREDTLLATVATNDKTIKLCIAPE